MIISMIAAHDPMLVIGRDGTLPWHIPEDLKHFKKRTLGHPVIMGRGVFDSLNRKLLSGRENLILSRSLTKGEFSVYSSVDELMAYLETSKYKKVYVIGGEQIYNLFYPFCHRLEMTCINKSYEGDTFFPDYRKDIGQRWKEVYRHEEGVLTFIDYDET